jgi:hypothetical protein
MGAEEKDGTRDGEIDESSENAVFQSRIFVVAGS